MIPRRLEARTGVLEFVKLITDHAHPPSDLLFVFTGSGPLFKEVLEISQPFSNILVTGFVPQEQLYALYNFSSLFVVPSIDAEGCCLPARIAFLLGKPILSTAQGGLLDAYPIGDSHFVF